MGKKKVYAVASGRTSGVIVSSWDECKDLVHGYTGAKFKSFSTREDAQQYLNAAVSTSLSSLSNKNNNKSIGTPSLAATLTTGLAVKVEQQQQQPIKRKTGVVTSAPAQQQAAAPAAASSIIENPYRKRVKLEDGVDQTTTRVAAIPPTSNRIRVHIMFDGGARGNPGIAGAGAMVSLQTVPHSTDAAMPTHHVRCYVGDKSTNNVAEYSGLVQGLAMAKEMVSNYHLLQRPQHSSSTTTTTTAIGELVVQGDSNLIIQQLNGIYKVKNAKLKELFGQVQYLLQDLRRLGLTHQVYEHVYRDGNKVADGTYFRIERPYESGWNGSPPNSLRSLFPCFVCFAGWLVQHWPTRPWTHDDHGIRPVPTITRSIGPWSNNDCVFVLSPPSAKFLDGLVHSFAARNVRRADVKAIRERQSGSYDTDEITVEHGRTCRTCPGMPKAAVSDDSTRRVRAKLVLVVHRSVSLSMKRCQFYFAFYKTSNYSNESTSVLLSLTMRS
jgi:ribonuclease HI